MAYEISGSYFDELSRAQQDLALQDLVADGALHGYMGQAPVSDDSDYIRAYWQGEDRRFAEMHQKLDSFYQGLKASMRRLDKIGYELAGLKQEVLALPADEF